MESLVGMSLSTVSKELGKVGLAILVGSAIAYCFYQEYNIHEEVMSGYNR